MGFWIFMLLMMLIVPITELIFGSLFLKKAPGNINYVFGYRTERSMKNKDTWVFAHTYIGKIWKRLGIVTLPVSVIIMLFVIGQPKEIVGTVGTVIELLQIAGLALAIIPTERALKKNFDRYGFPIKK